MPKTAHINIGDHADGPGFDVLGIYLDETGKDCKPDPTSPAHCAIVLLLRHLNTLGPQIGLKGQDIDLNNPDLRQFLDTKEHPEPSPIITAPGSEETH